MRRRELLFRSRRLPPSTSGTLLAVTPRKAGWELISFSVRRIVAGDAWAGRTGGHEVCLVLLRGRCRVSWGQQGEHVLGPRPSVFEAYPHAVYMPPGLHFEVRADELCEVAEGRAPADRALPPRIVRPQDCGYEIRGGGNATRQIVDILPPAFPADRLMVCEVFTPSGNWSSYPPHKHDRDNPPEEADLEEIYYYRMRDPLGYGFQRVYTADGRLDETLKVEDGDLVVVREGYHPFVTAFGYDAYYLNVLAGSQRSMAASDDPRHARFRRRWPAPDPRVPVVPRPAEASGAAGGGGE